MTRISKLWEDITATLFSNIDDAFLECFRAPGGANKRLAAWDPYDKSTRYYKFLLFNIISRKPDVFFESYRNLGDTSLGNPVTVSFRNCKINIDHLFSVEEDLFLKSTIDLKTIRHVVEIGAGFGRTCQGILKLNPDVSSYTIVDLPAVLNLSRNYLQKTIPDLFHKIKFIPNDEKSQWSSLTPDLVINIDSFQEMPPEVISDYRDNLILKSTYFYCKNPVGKYKPECVGLPPLSPEQLLDVYSLGLCQKVLDLFDEIELIEARKEYLMAYKPSNEWKVLGHAPLEIFPYFHHALFARNK